MPGATGNNVIEPSQPHFPTASVAVSVALGWLAPVLGLFSHLPPWATQAIVTILSAPVAAALAVIAKRWARTVADKYWPAAKRRPGDTDE